jgi:hypothetical protein
MEDPLSVNSDGRIFCSICNTIITGNSSSKTQKQHLKSITHKKALKNGGTTVSKDDNPIQTSTEFEVFSYEKLLEISIKFLIDVVL